MSRLTKRQLEVVGMICDGLTGKQMEERLACSRHGVLFHIRQICTRLDIKAKKGSSRKVQLAEVASMNGMISKVIPRSQMSERNRNRSISASQLRAEVIVDMGLVTGTQVLFVLTEKGVHLFNQAEIPGPSVLPSPTRIRRRPRVSRDLFDKRLQPIATGVWLP